MMVDCMSNRNLGILKSWKMLLDGLGLAMMLLDGLGPAIANPSCEVVAPVALEYHMVAYVWFLNLEFATSRATAVFWLQLS